MMKTIKWKTLIITTAVCLLAILPGLALWDKLPEDVAIHFNINNQADSFASKGFAVFGLPLIMVAAQMLCCVTTDINARKHGGPKKFEIIAKWTIPVVTIVLQMATLGYSLGWNVDIRRVAMLIVGVLFIVLGNYLPKLDYIKNYKIDPEKARKINRFIGFETVIMGILMLATLFMPPIASVVALFLLIPYIIAGVVFGMKVGRKKTDESTNK